jgi:hypothetical protein
MAAAEAERSICSRYFEKNTSKSDEIKCQNCLELIEYINVLKSELKSTQVINKILLEEYKQYLYLFKLGLSITWCPTGIHTGSPVILNLHQ